MPKVLTKDSVIHINLEEQRQFCYALGKCPKELVKICKGQLVRMDSLFCELLYNYTVNYTEESNKLKTKRGNDGRAGKTRI